MFMVFNILQRRQVLQSASAKVKGDSFNKIAHELVDVSVKDIEAVTGRVARGDYNTAYTANEKRVLTLMKEIKLVNRRVEGSNASRLAMQNEIRALMITHGFPSFFITINPADIYNPLVKFLAGHDINIDQLLPGEVPMYWDQSILIAQNPVVAAKFFNIYVKAFLKTLIGFDVEKQNLQGGVLGVVKAHYGCVEAQGRGMLHCHMLIWLEGGLDPNVLKKKLTDDPHGEFQRRLVEYLDDTIQTEIPPFSDDDQLASAESQHPCVTRGPYQKEGETIESFNRRLKMDEMKLAETCQKHEHKSTCFKNWRGPPHQKECRFQLDPENAIEKTSFDVKSGELT